MFMGMLNNWMEKEWPEQSRVCHFNHKIKYVLDATTLLGQLQYVGLGKKLKIILGALPNQIGYPRKIVSYCSKLSIFVEISGRIVESLFSLDARLSEFL